jgi:hypothetical protein
VLDAFLRGLGAFVQAIKFHKSGDFAHLVQPQITHAIKNTEDA